MDIVKHNEAAWSNEVASGNIWTKPVSAQEIANAKQGDWHLLLTPTKAVPTAWFGDVKDKRILCLASGGGQQGPILAALGGEVTVFDNCPAQLAQDQLVADREHLYIHLEQGDMRDLSRFADESFDLIFHAVSNCFVDHVETVWKECSRVLKKGGVLLAGFANPLIYIFDLEEWDHNSKLVVRYKIPYSDVEQLPKEALDARIAAKETIEFGHSLQTQIGGQLDAGFVLTGFYEDNAGGDLLDPHIDTYIATRAMKL